MDRMRLGALAGSALLISFIGCARTADRPEAGWGPAPAAAAPAKEEAASLLPENPALADYLAYAEAHNPGLAAARARLDAARERIPQAGALDDPRLSYMAAVAKDMRTHQVTVEQMFPWFGKLDLRTAVAREEVAAAQQAYEAQRLKVAYQVKIAYYEYYYLARSIDVFRDNRDLVKYLSEVSLAKYRTATAGHPDVIRAQVELGKLDDQWRSAEDLRGASAARLNAALGRSADAPVPWPAAIAEERVEVPDAEVLAWLVQASPELKELDHEIAREGHAIELARKDYWPDVGLGLGYMNQREIMEGSEDHMVVGMISVTLPIWRDKYAAEVREAEARRLAARHMRDDRQNMLAADVKMALYNLRDASRKINLYRDTLVPTAKESLKATEAAYRTGTANFVDLVDGERMLLEFRLMQERALTDHAARLAELEMLVGREMPRAAATPAKDKAAPETARPNP